MKYHIITYGCQMNECDSERMAGKLEKKGYKETDIIEKADLIIINACSVRQSAINRINSKIKKINNQKRKIKLILTGCLLEKDKERLKSQVDKIWPIIEFNNIQKHKNDKKAFIPIMNGCNNFCSYCVVPYTRGREISRPAKDIIKEIKCLIKKGYEEIMLLGQNVNSYNDDKINFPKLLEIICKISGDFKIKFMTSHPKDMSDELIDVIAKNEKISREIHLPVQSGSNSILKKMNRNYNIKHYKGLIRKIYKKIPNAKISTDIIVGFPGETKKQFQDTVNLIKEIKFYKAYIASYSPRPQTSASKLKDTISSFEKKQRKKILLNLLNAIN
ncbi:MiaB/RimO family radical SAM methylthiotransferase [Patescibacteria group bacterium]